MYTHQMIYPDFIDNKTFYSIGESEDKLDQTIALAQNIKKLHQLTTKNYENFDQLIDIYLNVGLEVFEMEIGIVSQVEGDDYVICKAKSPDASLNTGDIFPIEGTYCREVVKSGKVLGFPHVGGMEGMRHHPVYENMKLESYLSAPIYAFNKLFGTFNFSSTKIRKHGFSEGERDFIALMANAIGNFLTLKQKEQSLIQSNERMKQLIGHVAHDLRNPIGSIISFTELIELPENDTTNTSYLEIIRKSAENSLEIIHTILESAAIGTGKIAIKLVPADLSALVRENIRNFEKGAEKKNIKFESKVQNIKMILDPRRIDQVLSNLLSNAIKYTPDGGFISLELSLKNNNQAEFILTNGIDPEKLEQMSSDDFDLNKSIGFGLEIVREVLAMHNSDLQIKMENNSYQASFLLASPEEKT